MFISQINLVSCNYFKLWQEVLISKKTETRHKKKSLLKVEWSGIDLEQTSYAV
jgi:hypothetical protein